MAAASRLPPPPKTADLLVSLDPAQREGLERVRAIALAREHFELDASTDGVEVDAAPFGVTVHSSDRAVVVVSSDDLAVLGGVLVWVDRLGLDSVALVTEYNAGVHARRAAVLAPEITVHELNGAAVAPAIATPIAEPRAGLPDLAVLVAVIERSGAQVVEEDGIMRAEVAGLEVGRIVDAPTGPILEVGVGRFDREAGALLHSDRPAEPNLVSTIELVSAHRRAGAPSHAINRIGRERWLRDVVRTNPGEWGLTEVALVEPIPPRTSLLEAGPAALMADRDGVRTLVVCSVGVELGLVPELADLVTRHGPDTVLVLIPARDQLPFLARLSGRLPVPTSMAHIEVPWAD